MYLFEKFQLGEDQSSITTVPVDTPGRIAVEMLEELEDDEAADGVADEGELAVGRHMLLDEGDFVTDLA